MSLSWDRLSGRSNAAYAPGGEMNSNHAAATISAASSANVTAAIGLSLARRQASAAPLNAKKNPKMMRPVPSVAKMLPQQKRIRNRMPGIGNRATRNVSFAFTIRSNAASGFQTFSSACSRGL